MMPHGFGCWRAEGIPLPLGTLPGHAPLESAAVQVRSLVYVERPHVDVLMGSPARPHVTVSSEQPAHGPLTVPPGPPAWWGAAEISCPC